MIETPRTREQSHIMCVLTSEREYTSALFKELRERNDPNVDVQHGDTKIMWDPDNKDQVDSAQRTFDDLTRKNYWAYKTDKEGNRSERVMTFDKKAERLILMPRPVGG
jgi:hypothetical protein